MSRTPPSPNRGGLDYNIGMHPLPTLVSVEEYLRTSFSDGDREYIDGTIVERNLGDRDHSRAQGELIYIFRVLRATHKTYAFPEQRVQVKPTRFRVPDVCVYLGREPEEQVFRTPPFLAIEILSKDDRPGDVQEKVRDYLEFGTAFVWVIDPQARSAHVFTRAGVSEVADGILRTAEPAIEIPLADVLGEA